MKTNLILLSFFFHFTLIGAQQIDNVSSRLFVEKGGRILQFKPNKYLHLRKTNGQIYWSKKYFLQNECIIFPSATNLKQDTVQLKDISWIKGRTYGSGGRIVGGSLMILGAPTLGFMPVFVTAYVGGPAFLVAIPFAVMFGEGMSLMFPRKFNTEGKWQLEIMKQ